MHANLNIFGKSTERAEESKENPRMKSQDNHRNEESSDDDSSPRAVLEITVSGTDSEHSASSSSSSSSSGSGSNLYIPAVPRGLGIGVSGPQLKAMIGVFRKKSVDTIASIPLLATSYELSRKSLGKKLVARIRSAEDSVFNIGAIGPTKPSWRNFDYAELAAATNDFSPENLIGKGGHAEVFKGCLPDGQIVAVKRLIKNEKEEEDRAGDFLSELGIIAHINHPNAAHLVGFGIENGLYFVLQFAAQGSLASWLFGSECMDWKKRFKVALGIANGLRYLHHDCPRRIIHRDIKASNILLNQHYEPEISDFGLAKWLPDKWVHHVCIPIEGTVGYLAPEYFMHGIADEKTDVFAFGVLLLEIITGRRAVDSSRQSLVMWAKPFLDADSMKELADPKLGDAYDVCEMKCAMTAAAMCVDHTASRRPYMNQVVQILNGEGGPIELKQNSTGPKTVLLDGCESEDYTGSNYLNDLNRHRELVME